MTLFRGKVEISDVQQGGKNNIQLVGTNNTVNQYFVTPLTEVKKASIVQEVIDDLLELSVSFEATEPDVKFFDIENKIDYNQIVCYKASFEFFMSNKQVIQSRLDFLESVSNPLATKKLFAVIKNIYHKYTSVQNPDDIISLMQEDLSKSLDQDSYDNISFIPSVIFYVFSECQIFKKP